MPLRRQPRVLVGLTAAWVAWAGWAVADGGEAASVRVVDEEGAPVAEARVVGGGVTDGSGTVEVDVGSVDELRLEAEGITPARPDVIEVDAGEYVAVVRSWIARGVVADPTGAPVAGAVVSSGSASVPTGADGSFELKRAAPGSLSVSRPGWETLDAPWDGSAGKLALTIEPRTVRAVHVGAEAAESRWGEYVDLVERTELNGIMLDLKDETGTVLFDSEVPLAAGVSEPVVDLPAVAGELGEAGIYLIGRIVAFQDPRAAAARPDIAVTDPSTGGPFTRNGQTFLDPTDPDARRYALSLAEEACVAGVDEIQFDYVRYPDDFGDAVFDGGSDPDTRREAIRSFLAEAGDRLHPHGCAVAADVFGFTTTAVDDGGIGQFWEDITAVVDVVSPMVYPSHYGAGWYGFDRPLDHPGELVDRALSDGLARLSQAVVVRPWLQDFGYTAADVRAEIDAAEAHGLGWMLWNAASRVTVDALE